MVTVDRKQVICGLDSKTISELAVIVRDGRRKTDRDREGLFARVVCIHTHTERYIIFIIIITITILVTKRIEDHFGRIFQKNSNDE